MRMKNFISLAIVFILICPLNFSCCKKEQIRKDESKSMEENTNSNTNVGKQPDPENITLVAQAVTVPKQIKAPIPRYPSRARLARINATVILRVLVDEKGEPKEIIVLKCNAKKYHDEFIEASKEAAMKARWKPAYAGDKPVPVWVGYHIKFVP